MISLRGKRDFSVFFWSFFLALSALVAFFYFASLRTFGEDVWKQLSNYYWVFNALFLFLIAMLVSKILSRFLKQWLEQIGKVKELKVDKTRLSIAQSLLSSAIYITALLIIANSIPELRSYGLSLLAGVGFSAIVLGFAAQETLSNIIAGILIAIYQPFRVGDRVEFKKTLGRVEDISLRHTIIKTWENKRLVVPNSVISRDTITNYSLTDEKVLMSVEMSISYDSDINKAKKIMLSEAKKHKNFFNPPEGSSIINKKTPLKVRLVRFGESSVVLKLYFWARDYAEGFKMTCDLRESIKKRFDKEGIEIPYPYRTIVYKPAKAKK